MGRTVVSLITKAHLSSIRVICRFTRHTQHTFGQNRDSPFALTRQFRIKISMDNASNTSAVYCVCVLWLVTFFLQPNNLIQSANPLCWRRYSPSFDGFFRMIFLAVNAFNASPTVWSLPENFSRISLFLIQEFMFSAIISKTSRYSSDLIYSLYKLW